MPGGTLVNTGELEAATYAASRRVLEIQAKLHRWARDDPHRRFDDLFNLVADPAFLLVAWDRVRHGWRGWAKRPLRAGCRGGGGVPRPAAGQREGPQLLPGPGAGADDPQGRRPTAPPGERDHHRPGGPGVADPGAGADPGGGLPAVQLRLPPQAAGS